MFSNQQTIPRQMRAYPQRTKRIQTKMFRNFSFAREFAIFCFVLFDVLEKREMASFVFIMTLTCPSLEEEHKEHEKMKRDSNVNTMGNMTVASHADLRERPM
jgi:hypothetical protein